MPEFLNGKQKESFENNDPLLIAKGQKKGHLGYRKFGSNAEVGTSYEVVGVQGGTYPFPIVEDTLTVVSSSVNDDVSGTHATTIEIQGLDINCVEIVETIDLGGTTPVVTLGNFFRVNSALIGGVGVYGNKSDGLITISHTTSGDTLAMITADEGQTAQTVFTTPVGKSAFIDMIFVSTESTKPASFQLLKRLNADQLTPPYSPILVVSHLNGISVPSERNSFINGEMPPCTDFWVEAKVASSTADCSSELNFVLVDI